MHAGRQYLTPGASDPMSDHGDNTPPQGVKHITLVSADQSMQVY